MRHNIIKLVFLLIILSSSSVFYLPGVGLCTETAIVHDTDTHTQHAEHAEHAGQAEGHDGHASGGSHSTEQHGGGQHHIWWQFPGYEIVLGALSCLYFALFIIIVPFFFGKDLEGHH
jgi:hypothetical protein